MKLILTTCILLLLSVMAQAQTDKHVNTFEVEVDPIAYLFRGYSLHGIYQPGRLRFDAGIFGIVPPAFFHGNDSFEENVRGTGFKIHYLLQGAAGLFAGLGINYTNTKVTYQKTGGHEHSRQWAAGPEIGYRFFLFPSQQNSVYIAPWLGISYNFFLNDIQFPEDLYQRSPWTVFPTVHIGYRF